MTKFVDGPAAGQSLMLRRAAMLLRVTRKRFALEAHPQPHQKSPQFDALDQPDDTPNPDEEIFVYVNTHTRSGTCHMRFGGNQKNRSGFYAMAEYRLYEVQPADEIMRDNTKWRAWCEEQRPRLYPSQ